MILLFKSNVNSQDEAAFLKPHLDYYLKDIKWNFDLEDCDRILRVESELPNVGVIVKILNTNGFECEELID